MALAAGLVASQAQSNVYSANVVGYYNVAVTNGFTLLANQLDIDGTGTNNTVQSTIGTNLPSGTKCLAFNPATQAYATITLSGTGAWSAGVAGPIVKAALQPGGGVFLQTSVTTNITIVGNVLQQTNKTPVIVGFQVVSYPFPVAGGFTTNFNYIPAGHDKALIWNVGPQTFSTHTWGTTSWSLGDPQLSVGGALVLEPAAANVWTNGFVVQ